MRKKIKKFVKRSFWERQIFSKKIFLESQLFWKKNKNKKKICKKKIWERHLFFQKIFLESQLFWKKNKKKKILWSDTFFHSAIFIVAVSRGDNPPDQGLIINNIASEATTSRALFVRMTPGTMAARPSTPAI